MTEPRYARDMDPIERAYTEALHDIGCGDGHNGVVESWSTDTVSGPHPLEDHEPFDIDEGSIPWADMVAAFRKRGLVLVDLNTAFPDAATTPVAQGPVIVMHIESTPGSGLTACTGQPFSPWHITDPGEAILSCTGCLLVGVEDSPLERDISAQVGERVVGLAMDKTTVSGVTWDRLRETRE